MSVQKGTIYLRDNAWYRQEGVVKMGIASFAKDRSSTYITGEIERGEYLSVIEIPLDKMRILDKCLKNHFKPYHVYRGGGTEFYSREIYDSSLVINYLKELCGIEYRVLTEEEIAFMNRCNRLYELPHLNKLKHIFNELHLEKIIKKYKNKKKKIQNEIIESEQVIYNESQIMPKEHQQYILDIIEDYYQEHNIGKIIWACGLGKALVSVLIVKLLKFKTVAFGVPSNNLQKQIKNEILKIFPNKNNILFVGGETVEEFKTSNDKPEIIKFIRSSDETNPLFVISTYHSCHLLVDEDIKFDFKIGDEAHHLVGIEREEERGFRLFHKINSEKSLFMTATEKTIVQRTDRESYSMENDSVFGKYIDMKSVHWAIENKKITDYNILVLKNTEDEVNEIINTLRLEIKNKEIFMSCFMCLKSFEKYNDLTHLLLYTNTTEDAEIAKMYIDQLLELDIIQIPREKIYNNALYSKTCRGNDLTNEVDKFAKMPYGIISCVYIFGEGFDLPKLNGVCISGNMQSEIRIVQYLLRPNRLDSNNPNKKAYVIIPYIDSEDWGTESQSYEKVRAIISQMRNVDENIEQKIMVSVGKKHKKKKKREKVPEYIDFNFEEDCGELNRIKLRLRYSKSLGSNFSEEQDEYNYVRSVNISLGISSKREYSEKKDMHIHHIDDPEKYFREKGVWENWYDFMGVDTAKFIQSKDEWINYCNAKGIKTREDYNTACEMYDVLPKEPAEFYKDFSNILTELGTNKNRRK